MSDSDGGETCRQLGFALSIRLRRPTHSGKVRMRGLRVGEREHFDEGL